MGLARWAGKRLLIRKLERVQRDLREGKMSVRPGFKVAAVGVVVLLLHAAVEATQEYLSVDLTPTVSEWGRAALTAVIGAFLYWLRSPKDQPPTE